MLDENVDVRFAVELTARGHDVIRIGTELPVATRDVIILQTAVAQDRILVTNDEDYGELVFRDGLDHAGIIYMRLHRLSLGQQLALMVRALALMDVTSRPYVVLTPNGPRIG